MTSTDAILERHLEAMLNQDLEATMDDYAEDAALVTNFATFRGREEIAGMFENFYAEFSSPDATIEVEQETVEGDFAYVVWRGESPENVYEFATDTFYVPDAAIEFQTFAGHVTPKG